MNTRKIWIGSMIFVYYSDWWSCVHRPWLIWWIERLFAVSDCRCQQNTVITCLKSQSQQHEPILGMMKLIAHEINKYILVLYNLISDSQHFLCTCSRWTPNLFNDRELFVSVVEHAQLDLYNQWATVVSSHYFCGYCVCCSSALTW